MQRNIENVHVFIFVNTFRGGEEQYKNPLQNIDRFSEKRAFSFDSTLIPSNQHVQKKIISEVEKLLTKLFGE